jgi:carbonyl reductase 1
MPSVNIPASPHQNKLTNAVRHLALEYPSSSFNNGKLLIYLTARSKERGEAAVQDMLADSKLKTASALAAAGGLTDIKFQALDVTDSRSISEFSKYLKEEHPDGIDIAINNAGIGADGFSMWFLLFYNAQLQVTPC